MSALFGTGEKSADGYIIDAQTDQVCSRLAILIVDNRLICGRRIVFGSNDIAVASQIIFTLLVAKENVTISAEAPRFIIRNGSIGIEGKIAIVEKLRAKRFI